jgi:hypothetical protein
MSFDVWRQDSYGDKLLPLDMAVSVIRIRNNTALKTTSSADRSSFMTASWPTEDPSRPSDRRTRHK